MPVAFLIKSVLFTQIKYFKKTANIHHTIGQWTTGFWDPTIGCCDRGATTYNIPVCLLPMNVNIRWLSTEGL